MNSTDSDSSDSRMARSRSLTRRRRSCQGVQVQGGRGREDHRRDWPGGDLRAGGGR